MARTSRHEKTEHARKRVLLRTATRTERQTWRTYSRAITRTWEAHCARMDSRNMENV